MRRLAWVAVVGMVAGGAVVFGACKSQPELTPRAKKTAEESAKAGAKAMAQEATFFGNAVCPIMGNPTNPALFVDYSDPPSHTYAKVYMCCPGCTEAIKKDTAAAYKKAYLDRELKDAAGKVIAAKGAPQDIANTTCPVTGEKVSTDCAMVYNGRKIGLCCPDCEKNFLKSPEKYLADLLKPSAGATAK